MNTMNERLREFERASGLEIYGLGAKRVPWEAAMERFAELIVEEMYVFMCNATENDKPWPTFKEVKEHFGVEE